MKFQQVDAAQQSRPRNGERESSDGWATVEGEMLKHDEGIMKGYAKDVDTLLVFAGLFSAVVTAFVVQSYQQLQTDTGQTSVLLLRRISVQLESFTLSRHRLDSSSHAPPLPPLDFTADSTTRWINILWFLSLIFSLAAALFGILVKQWIHEYMQWNAALGDPRDNVLVRQDRFEAWAEWNVPTTIAAIPALLELAVVFFVFGLIILLWTLDPVVSIVITIAAATFLLIISTFTILPAFFARCPYKSPTAWACAVVWDILSMALVTAAEYLKYHILHRHDPIGRRRFISKHREARSTNWRQRDLASIWSSFSPRKSEHAVVKLVDELSAEQSTINMDDQVVEQGGGTEAKSALYNIGYKDPTPLQHALRIVTEMPPLIRALSWVSHAVQDPHVHRSVSYCVESLQQRFLIGNPVEAEGRRWPDTLSQQTLRNISMWHLVLDLLKTTTITTPFKQFALPDRPTNLTDVRAGLKVHCPSSTSPPSYFHHVESNASWRMSQWHTIPETPTISHLLALSIKAAIYELTALPNNLGRAAETQRHGRRVLELLAALKSLYRHQLDDNISSVVAVLLGDAYTVASSGGTKEKFDLAFPGIRINILFTAMHLGFRLTKLVDGVVVVEINWQPRTTEWHLDEVHLALTLDRTTPEDQHMSTCFLSITIAAVGWYDADLKMVTLQQQEDLLNRMVNVAEACLEQSIPNCGSYIPLSWFRWQHRQRSWGRIFRTNRGPFIRLLLVLAESDRQGLLTGSAGEDLRETLRTYLHVREALVIQSLDVPSEHEEDIVTTPVDNSGTNAFEPIGTPDQPPLSSTFTRIRPKDASWPDGGRAREDGR